MTKEEFETWPKCAVPACCLKSCRLLESAYCWPHTKGTPPDAVLIEAEIAERQAEPMP